MLVGVVAGAHERARGNVRRGSRDRLHDVKRPSASTIPTGDAPVLTDDQRKERLRLLAERLRRPDGLDRETLMRIEELTDDEQ